MTITVPNVYKWTGKTAQLWKADVEVSANCRVCVTNWTVSRVFPCSAAHPLWEWDVKIVSCFFEISADPTSSVTSKMLELVHTDLFWIGAYVWSGSIAEPPCMLRGVCGEIEVLELQIVAWYQGWGVRKAATAQSRFAFFFASSLYENNSNPLFYACS